MDGDVELVSGPNGSFGALYVLDERQRRAVDMLAAGDSDDAVADAVGVTRDVLAGWRLNHPAFQAAVNRADHATWAGAQSRVRALLPRALDRLADALDDPERGPAVALALVRLSGVVPRTGLEPRGATNADAIVTNRRDTLERDYRLRSLTGGTMNPVMAEHVMAEGLREHGVDVLDGVG